MPVFRKAQLPIKETGAAQTLRSRKERVFRTRCLIDTGFVISGRFAEIDLLDQRSGRRRPDLRGVCRDQRHPLAHGGGPGCRTRLMANRLMHSERQRGRGFNCFNRIVAVRASAAESQYAGSAAKSEQSRKRRQQRFIDIFGWPTQERCCSRALRLQPVQPARSVPLRYARPAAERSPGRMQARPRSALTIGRSGSARHGAASGCAFARPRLALRPGVLPRAEPGAVHLRPARVLAQKARSRCDRSSVQPAWQPTARERPTAQTEQAQAIPPGAAKPGWPEQAARPSAQQAGLRRSRRSLQARSWRCEGVRVCVSWGDQRLDGKKIIAGP